MNIKLFLFLISLILIGTIDAYAHQLFFPSAGVFGNWSKLNHGFEEEDGTRIAGGGKIGLWAGVLGGIDLAWSRSNLQINKSMNDDFIEHIDLSVFSTHPAILEYVVEKRLNVIPYLSLGAGYYNCFKSTGKLGCNVGLRFQYFFFGLESIKNPLVGLDIGGYYHIFPGQEETIRFSEIRAGITYLFENF